MVYTEHNIAQCTTHKHAYIYTTHTMPLGFHSVSLSVALPAHTRQWQQQHCFVPDFLFLRRPIVIQTRVLWISVHLYFLWLTTIIICPIIVIINICECFFICVSVRRTWNLKVNNFSHVSTVMYAIYNCNVCVVQEGGFSTWLIVRHCVVSHSISHLGTFSTLLLVFLLYVVLHLISCQGSVYAADKSWWSLNTRGLALEKDS